VWVELGFSKFWTYGLVLTFKKNSRTLKVGWKPRFDYVWRLALCKVEIFIGARVFKQVRIEICESMKSFNKLKSIKSM
jgi:hypothetical protein